MPTVKGTPSSTGLIHMPFNSTVYADRNIEFTQVGGFGPFTRDEAFRSARVAGVVGRCKPQRVWIQRPQGEMDPVLQQVHDIVTSQFKRVEIVRKEDSAAAGFGAYYLYGNVVIMEHTSDPESKILRKRKEVALPHFHVETIDYESIVKSCNSIAEEVKKISDYQIVSGSGDTFKVKRLVRMGVRGPDIPDAVKLKMNHHIYYEL